MIRNSSLVPYQYSYFKFSELLAEEHSEKVQEIEEAEMAVKQTKQDVYQAKFREEMEAYKRTGELPQAGK